MPEPIHQFIADCELLLSRHAAKAAQFVGGTLHRDATTYDTPGLLVVAGKSRELEIRIRYLNDAGRVTENPVLMRAENGDIYRTHGEWGYGKKRVERLLAGENPETPIAIGPGPNGFSTGLD